MANGNCHTKLGGCIFIVAVASFILSSGFVDSRKFGTEKPNNPVKTIKGDGGDLIDCVDIYKQPALNHPLLKNHTIQLTPPTSTYPSGINEPETSDDDELFHSWRLNGECPEGTIPVVRRQRFESDVIHRSKPTPQFNGSKVGRVTAPPGYEYALVTLYGSKYYGAQATLNVWSPASFNNEHSIAQIWISDGDGEARSTIEAGWMRNSDDKYTRLFTFWTGDNYKGGCYNLRCPGFVQISRKFALDYAIEPVSSYNGKQYDISISIFMGTGQWWLKVQNEVLGYWPDTIFSGLKDGADRISWGGEITNSGTGDRHTSTQMGSGHFPSEGFGKASYFRSLQYADNTRNFKDVENLETYATKPSCYDVLLMKRTPTYGTYFYFGGPGYSPSCPN